MALSTKAKGSQDSKGASKASKVGGKPAASKAQSENKDVKEATKPTSKQSRKRAADLFDDPPNDKAVDEPDKPAKKAKTAAASKSKSTKAAAIVSEIAEDIKAGLVGVKDAPKPKITKGKEIKAAKVEVVVVENAVEPQDVTTKPAAKPRKKAEPKASSKERTEGSAIATDPPTELVTANPPKGKKETKTKDGAGTIAKKPRKKVVQPAEATATKSEVTGDASTSKKRKSPADADAVEQSKKITPVPDAKKKQKTTEESAEESTGSVVGSFSKILSSGLQAASKRMSGIFSTASNALGSSITDDVAEVAGAAANSKLRKSSHGEITIEAFDNDDDEGDSDDDLEEDDQTATLLKGFESDNEEAASGDEGFKEGKTLPKLPKAKNLSKKLKNAASGDKDEPGVVYVGRIPHGFHEHEMRAYFSQFGTVEHVRLSRSKKTGNSKHYGFLQFASSEVARIVADTMNNYLLFGHILKCHVIPKEQIHKNLWVGADKRFKKVPWNQIEGRKLDLAKGRSEWTKKIEKETQKRSAKAEKLKDIGYEFEAPELKTVDDVPQRPKPVEAAGESGEFVTIAKEAGVENGVVVVSEIMKKQKPKNKVAVAEAPDVTATGTEEPQAAKKAKKQSNPSKIDAGTSKGGAETEEKKEKSKAKAKADKKKPATAEASDTAPTLTEDSKAAKKEKNAAKSSKKATKAIAEPVEAETRTNDEDAMKLDDKVPKKKTSATKKSTATSALVGEPNAPKETKKQEKPLKAAGGAASKIDAAADSTAKDITKGGAKGSKTKKAGKTEKPVNGTESILTPVQEGDNALASMDAAIGEVDPKKGKTSKNTGKGNKKTGASKVEKPVNSTDSTLNPVKEGEDALAAIDAAIGDAGPKEGKAGKATAKGSKKKRASKAEKPVNSTDPALNPVQKGDDAIATLDAAIAAD